MSGCLCGLSFICGSAPKSSDELSPECSCRAQYTWEDPEEPSVELLHVVKHLTNLKFRVWEKMQEIVEFSKFLCSFFVYLGVCVPW